MQKKDNLQTNKMQKKDNLQTNKMQKKDNLQTNKMQKKDNLQKGGSKNNKELKIWERTDLQPNKILQDMYRKNIVKTNKGEIIKLSSQISPKEGWYLYSLIKKHNFKKVLEVGMANGTSALYICQAFKDKNIKGNLISIDPFQSTQWKNVGMSQLERANLKKYHSLIEESSDLALPELLKSDKKFDMIFIDGMHLYDYTLIDIYYATKLINMGGLIVVDDIRHKGVKEVIYYIKKNYIMLKFIENNYSSDTMATFKKIKEDDRQWNFHRNICF